MFSRQTNDVIMQALIEEIAIRGKEWLDVRHEKPQERPMDLRRRRGPAEEAPSKERKMDLAMMGILDAVAALNEFLEGNGETAATLFAAGGDEQDGGV